MSICTPCLIFTTPASRLKNPRLRGVTGLKKQLQFLWAKGCPPKLLALKIFQCLFVELFKYVNYGHSP